jgi:hypothetical protein
MFVRRKQVELSTGSILVVGLDAASNWRNFGYALGRYVTGQRITVEAAGILGDRHSPRAIDEILVPALLSGPKALIAIDSPLGWPAALGESLAGHAAGAALDVPKDVLFRRCTDGAVRRNTGKIPLEVGAEKIARAAHSALAVLQCLREATGQAIPMAWSPSVAAIEAIEVYPAATLVVRGLLEPGYKLAESVVARQRMVRKLGTEITGLGEFASAQDDVFDACLCLLAGKDFLDGRAVPPTSEQLPSARKEGWIWARA